MYQSQGVGNLNESLYPPLCPLGTPESLKVLRGEGVCINLSGLEI